MDSQHDRQDLFVSDEHLSAVTQILDGLTGNQNTKSMGLDLRRVFAMFNQATITYTIIILSIFGYLVKFLPQFNHLITYFTFTEVQLFISYTRTSSLAETYLEHHQWWRLVTPVFLHFGLFHVLFNTTAALEFGRRLELSLQPIWYLLLLLVLAVGSNTAQYLYSGSSMFGGLSGVVYGLFGALITLSWRTQLPHLKLPRGFTIMMLIALLLGPLGVIEKAFGIRVADQAHLGGLIIGLLAGLLLPYTRLKSVASAQP